MMKNTVNYILKGDYYIPDITLPECPKPVGRWGRLYQNYLKNHHPVRETAHHMSAAANLTV